MKSLSKIRTNAEKVLKSKNKSKEEKSQAEIILSLCSVAVVLTAQRNNWLSAFVEAKDLLKEGKKKMKDEDKFVESFLKPKK